MTSTNKQIEFAEWTKQFMIYYFRDFDSELVDEGPIELFEMFFSNFGYNTSDSIRKEIILTGVFSDKELSVLLKIEKMFYQLIENHKNAILWNYIRKEEYLKIKSLSYDFLNLVYKKSDH